MQPQMGLEALLVVALLVILLFALRKFKPSQPASAMMPNIERVPKMPPCLPPRKRPEVTGRFIIETVCTTCKERQQHESIDSGISSVQLSGGILQPQARDQSSKSNT